MGYTTLKSIKTLSFVTITNVIGSAVNYNFMNFQSYKFDAEGTNLHGNPRWQICSKYAYSSIGQLATGTTLSDDVNWSL